MKAATSKPCREQTLSDKNSKQENHQMYKRRRSYREGHNSDELEQMSPRTWTCSKERDRIISEVSLNTQFLLSMQLKRQGSFGKRTLYPEVCENFLQLNSYYQILKHNKRV